jgi:hypothetical protein
VFIIQVVMGTTPSQEPFKASPLFFDHPKIQHQPQFQTGYPGTVFSKMDTTPPPGILVPDSILYHLLQPDCTSMCIA